MIHMLKINQKYFDDIVAGRKTFEVRRDDRGYDNGDTLVLQEYDCEAEDYTGNTAQVRVMYMLDDDLDGIEDGYCVMGISLLPEHQWA